MYPLFSPFFVKNPATLPAGGTRDDEAGLNPISARTAIVHDWFQGFHGSERVVEAMRSLFAPGNDPDIFTFHAAREFDSCLIPRSFVKYQF